MNPVHIPQSHRDLLESDACVALRNRSPLILGLGNGENFIGSDPQALLSYTRRVLFLDDEEMALVTAGGVKVWDLAGNEKAQKPMPSAAFVTCILPKRDSSAW